MPRRTLTAVAALAVACRSAPSGEAVDACSELAGGDLESDRVRVSEEGRLPRCGDDAFLTRAFLDVHRALDAIPLELGRPKHVDVRIEERLDGISYDTEKGAILVHPGASDELVHSVWLHEIAHVIVRGGRPERDPGRRVMAAVEEGVADWMAASLSESPELGRVHAGRAARGSGARKTGDAVRDLRFPPPRSTTDWAMLALPGIEKDVHELGWQLAALLFRAEPAPGPLLSDVVRALSDPAAFAGRSDTPGGALEAFVLRCPQRSRQRLRDVLVAWVPRELFPG
jgi:hypothetical protein